MDGCLRGLLRHAVVLLEQASVAAVKCPASIEILKSRSVNSR
jgi:hypothetical protein